LKASAPPRIPLSSSTGARPSTASRISGSVESGDRAVDLAPAVVRHDDSVHAVVERALGVLAVEDALEDDRQPRALAQEGQVLPGQRRAGVDGHEALHRGSAPARAQRPEERSG